MNIKSDNCNNKKVEQFLILIKLYNKYNRYNMAFKLKAIEALMLREKKGYDISSFWHNPAVKTSPRCALWNGEYGEDPYDPSCYQLGPQNKYA